MVGIGNRFGHDRKVTANELPSEVRNMLKHVSRYYDYRTEVSNAEW